MEIQQHDGVVVEAAGISAGLRQAQREGEVSREGEGGARAQVFAALPSPTIYRAKGEGEGTALPLPPRKGPAKGGRSPSSPRHLGGAFPF